MANKRKRPDAGSGGTYEDFKKVVVEKKGEIGTVIVFVLFVWLILWFNGS